MSILISAVRTEVECKAIKTNPEGKEKWDGKQKRNILKTEVGENLVYETGNATESLAINTSYCKEEKLPTEQGKYKVIEAQSLPQ